MKLTYSLILAAAASGFAFGQTTATTTPVGYVSLGDTTVGQPAIKANTDVWISIPLDKPTTYAGTISLVAGDVITISGTPGLGDLTTIPHTVKIGSGAKEGLIALITGNTTDTVTVSVAAGDSLAGVASPDKISISEAWTVLGLMGSAMPIGTTLYTYPASSGLNPSSDGIYDWDGSNWIDEVNTGSPADNDVLYPSETLVVRNVTGSPINSFVITGEVPTVKSRVVIAANGVSGADNAVSFFSPVGEPIGISGLSAIANNGDIVYGYDNNASGINKSGSSIHEYLDGNWIDQVNTGEADNNFPLGGGNGFLFRRVSTAPVAPWSDLPVYLPFP